MDKIKLSYTRLFFTLCFIILALGHIDVHAATKNISIRDNDTLNMSVYIGDSGRITPDLSSIKENSASSCSFEFSSDDSDIVEVNEDGTYTAVAPGTTQIYISAYKDSDYRYYRSSIFHAVINFTVSADMTNVTLSTTKVRAYMYPYYSYGNKPSYDSARATITINSDFMINSYDDDAFSYTCSNSKLNIDAYIEDNIIYLHQSSTATGTAKITFTIYGKVFTVDYESKKLGISNQSYLLVKNKKKKLTVSGYDGTVVWTSSNPKIATVDANGNVNGKKIGNCIITAKVGDQYLGCAVSVTKSKIKKVTERATYIGTHWKYSQALRTRKGYYDCSALVWKAYKEKANVTFGSKNYPGVALSEAKWCKSHKKMISGGITRKKLNKMTVNPGDLLFKSANMKKKYSNIYHVEMFTGYYCNYVDSNGCAYFSPLWAARGSYYNFEDGSLLGRPLK